MPRQSGNSVRGRTDFSKSWGLQASVSFPPFPSPFSHFFCPCPNFRALKKGKMLQTCGKPYGNACYAGYHIKYLKIAVQFFIFFCTLSDGLTVANHAIKINVSFVFESLSSVYGVFPHCTGYVTTCVLGYLLCT